MASIPDVRNEIVAEDIDWRAGLLKRVSVVVVVLLGVAGFAVHAGFQSDAMRVFGIVLMASSPVLLGVLAIPRIPYPAKSAIVITTLAIASITAYLIAGFLPGSALGVAFALVLAALLFGRRAFILMLLVFTVMVLALATLVSIGIWQGPGLMDTDPSSPTNWYRTSAISVLLWASLGFSVIFVVNAVEENLARRRAALDSLQKEMAERRAAEKARHDAEEVAGQAQKMEAVGQLAAGIAHDFNNALLVIQGWNEMRGEFDVDDQQRQATEMIQQAADHTAQLSRQLLTFARKDLRDPKYLCLDKLVNATGNSLRHLIGPRIELSFDFQTSMPVHVDESQIQQLVFNLVLNARDAMAGEGVIRLAVRDAFAGEVEAFSSKRDRWVVLEVEDNGPGIEKAIQPRIFEPFFTTKAPGKGTGLGLSTVFGIVQQSGGHTDLKSRPGCTIFSIFLPVAEAESVDASGEPTPNETTELDLRTLLIEDDPLARQLIATALRDNGNDVVECGNGDAALSLLNNDTKPFDLLCSDAFFPGAGLGEILETFEHHSPAAKVLICSAYVREDVTVRKLESGDYAFLAKPFTGSRLIARIREVVR